MTQMTKEAKAELKKFEARRKEMEKSALIEAEMQKEVLVAKIQAEINARNKIIEFADTLLAALKPFDGKVMNKKIKDDLMDSLTIIDESTPPDSNGWQKRLFSAYMRDSSYSWGDFEEEGVKYTNTQRVTISICAGISIKCRKFDRVWKGNTFTEEIVPLWIGADDTLRNFEYYIYTTVVGSTARYSHYATEKRIMEQVEQQKEAITNLMPYTDIEELLKVRDEHAKLKKAFNDYHNSVGYKVREVLDLRD